jgi:hypothetical protein
MHRHRVRGVRAGEAEDETSNMEFTSKNETLILLAWTLACCESFTRGEVTFYSIRSFRSSTDIQQSARPQVLVGTYRRVRKRSRKASVGSSC